jgi:hypothetical protein
MHSDAAQHPARGRARYRDMAESQARDGAVIHFEHGALRFAFTVTHFT